MWRHVADVLQRDIIFGRLQPREHLIEDEIMLRIGASRHAVRRSFDEMDHASSTLIVFKSIDLEPLDPRIFSKDWVEHNTR